MARIKPDIFEQPGCSTNAAKTDKEKKKGCARPTPGATAGGCAYDGAFIALCPIADAAHLIHGPASCANGWDGRGTRTTKGTLYRTGFTTGVTEHDIIFGGEEKIIAAVQQIVERYAPPAVFVYATCVTAMIGDDLDNACTRAADMVNTPVIPVHAPGFVGAKNLGNKLAGEALMQHVIGTAEPEIVTDRDIAVYGEYNIAGELWQVVPELDALSIRILSSVSGDASYSDVTHAHRAKAGMVVCSKAMVSLAESMKRTYGVPYFEGSFYGIKETSNSLVRLAELIGDESLIAETRQFTARREAETFTELAPYMEKLTGKNVFVYSGGVKSWSMVYQMEELGMNVLGTSTRKSTEADIERIRVKFEAEQKLLMEKGDARKLMKILEDGKADILVAGGRNMYNAMKSRMPFVDVNQERIHGYAGYTGMIELAKQLVQSLESPIFALASTKAPWEDAS